MTETEFQVQRVTSEADRERLYRLRYEIFTREQGYAIPADHARGMLVDELDDGAEHFAVTHRGEMVASLRILYGADKISPYMAQGFSLERFSHVPPDQMAFCGWLFVLPPYRSSAALFRLVQHCYRVSRERGTRIDFICCSPHLVRLYEQLGYRRYRASFEDRCGQGYRVTMVLILDDVEHLRRVRSPLYLSARRLPADPALAEWFTGAFPEHRGVVSPFILGAERFAEVLSARINENVALLQGLDPAERQALCGAMTHLEVAAGTRLFRSGDAGNELFLVLGGTAEIRWPRRDGGGPLVTTLGHGDVFGEMGMVSGRPRKAEVVARTDLEVIFFDDASLGRLIKTHPALAAKLLLNLSRILTQRMEITSGELGSGARDAEPAPLARCA